VESAAVISPDERMTTQKHDYWQSIELGDLVGYAK
jgi:hypothetical protein